MRDGRGFRTIVAAHQERTYWAAFRILADREEALDITQDAFLALHQKAARVGAARIGAWLVRVATNRALDRLRGRKRQRPVVALDLATEPATGDEPGAAVVRAEQRQRVLAALAELPERQRQVVTMRVVEEMSFPEISQALALSEGAAKVHFRRGVAALTERLRRPATLDPERNND